MSANMSYGLLVLRFYAVVLLLQTPWWLLLWGAVRRVRRRGGRLRRLQVEGALILVAGTAAKWLVFDTHFGFDRLNVTLWSYWFSRGEVGVFFIGLLLFGLGFFLDRRPRPGLVPWPRTVKRVCIAALLSGGIAGAVAYILVGYRWFELPWSAARVLFSLGMLPFAIGYVLFGSQAIEPPAEP